MFSPLASDRIVAIILLALFAAMPASARTLVFKHFDAQIQVHPDGTIDVTEVIEAQFTGAWHGIYRTIPVEYTDAAGLNYTLLLDQISATDSDGQKLKLEQNREGRYIKFKIYVPAAEDATRTIVLHYRVLDALRFFQDHDELYWNVTGNEWENPIELVTAHIELPAGVTGLHAVAYTGVTGSRTEDARVEISDNVVDIRSTRRLGYRQGLTAVVGFDKGFVHPPSGSMQFDALPAKQFAAADSADCVFRDALAVVDARPRPAAPSNFRAVRAAGQTDARRMRHAGG